MLLRWKLQLDIMNRTSILRSIKNGLSYVVLWLIVSIMVQILYFDMEEELLPQFITTLIGIGLVSVPIYFAISRLLPRYLYRKKIGAFLFRLHGYALLNSIFSYFIGQALYAMLTNVSFFNREHWFYYLYMFTIIFTVNISLLVFACAIRIVLDRYKMQDRLDTVSEEKKTTELSFLRAQINPHFFFNVLNTIYFQIKSENLAARETVESLSEMMRYQLYECIHDKIDIQREVKYISNYVSLQRLRREKETQIDFAVSNSVAGFQVAPLLLIPLVENAFKHIFHLPLPGENAIRIVLNFTEGGTFIAEVTNTCMMSGKTQQLNSSNGLGLNNLKRRLQLLYPLKHQFTCNNRKGVFTALLTLEIHD